jgi:Sap, sulfolipid-1-addressing protein
VLAALAVVIPLGLGGAVSPVMLTEQTVLLAGPAGGRAGVGYAAGVVLTTFVIVVAIVLFGRAISLPTEPHLDATLDLVLGLVLVNVAVLVLVSGRRRRGSPSRKRGEGRGASGSFAFGVFAMATNITTLALIAPAAKEIARADVEIAAEAVLVLVLVGLVSMPAWVPLVLTRVAPGPSQRGLAAVRDQIARRGRGFTVGLLSAAGLFFIGRGLIRLLG